jgi:hypothetical protein
MKRFSIVFLVIALSTAGTLPGSLWAADSLAGRDIVDQGSKLTLSGTLIDEDGEWSLKTADKTYAVHLGNYAILYPKGINLKDGAEARVRGFLVGEDVSAISLVTNGSSYTFRNEDGTPLWAGRGNKRNAVDEKASPRTRNSRFEAERNFASNTGKGLGRAMADPVGKDRYLGGGLGRNSAGRRGR